MKAFIVGALGQDGSYLAELLDSKNYEVYGVVKYNSDPNKIAWLKSLVPSIQILPMNISNPVDWDFYIKTHSPDEIYNFAGVTNIFDPWTDVEQTFQLNANVPQIIMETIRKVNKEIKYFQASSCLIFGNDSSGWQDEMTYPRPTLPYSAAKLYADNMVRAFRETFGMFCCSGIFFNHESPRRGSGFFTKKVTTIAKQISAGSKERLKIGNLFDMRDYGYAPDFMEAVHLMMTNRYPTDYVIGTGALTSTKEFIQRSFEHVNLNFADYIDIDNTLLRPERPILRADINKITRELKWTPKHSVEDLISIMMKDEK